MNENIIEGIIAEEQPFLKLGESLSFIYNNILLSINEQSSKSTAMIRETYQNDAVKMIQILRDIDGSASSGFNNIKL
ncbi:unnamed protein product [Rotaria magnacalcarata]|uniref:Uncharacterized protein n=1 Tax=Rotaria magnacalcarata TaxID=392030 RepID=A0A820QRZ7_9BILA|nr:unnamed protein product [Rotaria magnacalcarata]CAF4425685.1 unnamed protein product [Rotaria magnacalcarata]CAF4679194.1 unnamed protein product [Rotaria magnacalcarata]